MWLERFSQGGTMKLLRFLKSTRGAIKPLNALLVSGAAGVGFFFIANTAANHQVKAERQIRSLSSIEQSAVQSGPTSIKVSDAGNRLATPEERAAMGGNSALDRYNANQKALGNLEASFGRSAEFSDSDVGLNTGNRDYSGENTRFSVGNPNAMRTPSYGSDSYGGSNDYDGGASSSGGQSSFAKASMARASGNSFGATSGPISMGGSAGGANGAAGSAGGEGARLSGSMPGGSNIISQMGLDGNAARTNTSSFGAGNRNTRGRGGRETGTGKGELSDILKKSAAAAANANASSNEGGRAFLASAKSSGGLSVDGTGTVGYATSSDFEAVTAKKLKAIGKRMDAEQAYQEGRERAHKHLQNFFWGMFAASVAGIMAISLLHKVHHPWVKWVQWILVAGIVVAQEEVIRKVVKFTHNYPDGGTAFTKLMVILAPVLVGAAVYSAIKSDAWSHIWGEIKKKFVGMFGLAGITSTVMGTVGGAAKNAVGEAMNKKGK